MIGSTRPDIDRLAERMLRDYDAHTPGTLFAEGFRPTLDKARLLQDAVARLRVARGEQVAGYKIGCVCPHNQRNNGLTHPVWGRLWSTEQHTSGVRLIRTDFANVAIEGEFAVTLGRDIEPEDASLDAVARAVERIVPVIELHNLVFRGGDPKGPELIANNAIHSGVVRGTGELVPAAAQAICTDLSIQFDGDVVDAWTDIRWPDDILQAVGWLIENLGQSGDRLQRGQTILTGALGPPLPVADVDHVLVKSSRFGHVEARFD
ncbi:MAG: 2-keto-4-pentenoate hydratase [Planctomycetaceae bacterium]